MSEEGKGRAVTGDQRNQLHYGTFQGVANYYPPAPQPQPQPVVGFPQPVPPPGYHHHLPYGYQTGQGDRNYPTKNDTTFANISFFAIGFIVVQGYAVVEGTPVREPRLPCCGIGTGWFLFLIGFFCGGIPWYIGTFILLCARVDYREKPGYIACTIASTLCVIAVVLGVTRGAHDHGW